MFEVKIQTGERGDWVESLRGVGMGVWWIAFARERFSRHVNKHANLFLISSTAM